MNVNGMICFMIGLFLGGATGVATICLLQVERCTDCPYRK